MSPADGRRIVITGIASHWGSELARRLERDPRVAYLAGIDTRPPSVELARTDFIEADVRSPLLSRLLPGTRADIVVHCGVLWYPEPGKPARALHDINVIGTLQLLAACERTESLRRLVVRSSAAIYGCEGTGPLFFTEELARELPLRTRFQRDISELEGYFDNFARRHPDVAACVLRYQPELGVELDAPLVRYLTLPVVPTQLGFDPRLQPLHAEDATGALEAAVWSDARGAVNVAPPGALSLSRVLRICGRPSLPVPHPLFAALLERTADGLGAAGLLGDWERLLRFGRAVDSGRMVEELPYRPRFDAEGAVRDFAAKAGARRLVPSLRPGAVLGRLAGAAR